MKILGRQCTGCEVCYSIGPKNAIKMIENNEGFRFPSIDESLCVHCNLCMKVCPLIDGHAAKLLHEPTKVAYACKARSKTVQLNSTSGGFFTSLAHKIISMNGIVYGAGYTEDWRVEHMRICEDNALHLLAESKYTQSKIGNTYCLAKQDLKQNKLVLFSGTSCQIAGLKAFLKREFDNLLLVDVVCHGVPPPRVWNWYINQLQLENKARANLVKHKGKDEGGWAWQKQYLKINFKNGFTMQENIWENSFMKGFLKDINLRNSCYQCHFKNLDEQRVSDLTIADYWGCEIEEPDFFDVNGVSLVLVNSSKGSNALKLLDNCILKKTDINWAIKWNGEVLRPFMKPGAKKLFLNSFFGIITTEKFSALINQCIEESEKEKDRIIYRFKRKWRKVKEKRRA